MKVPFRHAVANVIIDAEGVIVILPRIHEENVAKGLWHDWARALLPSTYGLIFEVSVLRDPTVGLANRVASDVKVGAEFVKFLRRTIVVNVVCPPRGL
jgi:hypothetical protein